MPAEATGAGTIVVEDLGFTDPTTREQGRGRRIKAFRKTVAGIPTSQLRSRLVAMAARRAITVVTQRWGRGRCGHPDRAAQHQTAPGTARPVSHARACPYPHATRRGA